MQAIHDAMGWKPARGPGDGMGGPTESARLILACAGRTSWSAMRHGTKSSYPHLRSDMPLVRQLIDAMERVSPTRFAEPWDNVGLLVGDPDQELPGGVLLCIDMT